MARTTLTAALIALFALAAPALPAHAQEGASSGETSSAEQEDEQAGANLPLFMQDGPWMRGAPAYPSQFECNGDWDDGRGFCWLASSNPFQFRKSYTARFFFEELPDGWDRTKYFWVQLVAKVYDQSPSLGGVPDDAAVNVSAKNPNSDEAYTAEKVRVETTEEGLDLPAWVQVPIEYVSDDGRVTVTVSGVGSIGISEQRLRLFFPHRGQE